MGSKATHFLSPSRWSARHIVLATTAMILTGIAIGSAVTISLAPARLRFSIKSATLNTYGGGGGDNNNKQRYYNFTIVLNNTSSHTKVHYAALSTEIWYTNTGWVPAEADTSAWPWLGPHGNKSVDMWAVHSQYTVATADPKQPQAAPAAPPPPASSSSIQWPICKVEVVAQVWFKLGRLASTRTYTVRSSCYPVDFSHGTAYAECIP